MEYDRVLERVWEESRGSDPPSLKPLSHQWWKQPTILPLKKNYKSNSAIGRGSGRDKRAQELIDTGSLKSGFDLWNLTPFNIISHINHLPGGNPEINPYHSFPYHRLDLSLLRAHNGGCGGGSGRQQDLDLKREHRSLINLCCHLQDLKLRQNHKEFLEPLRVVGGTFWSIMIGWRVETKYNVIRRGEKCKKTRFKEARRN